MLFILFSLFIEGKLINIYIYKKKNILMALIQPFNNQLSFQG